MARRPRVKTKMATLARDAAGSFRAVTAAGDEGAELRHQHAGGVIVSNRRTENGGVVKGAWALEPGPFETLAAAGYIGVGRDRERRTDAAWEFRRVAQRAKLRRSVTGGYLLRTGGSPGVDLEAEAREERARQALADWGEHLGLPVLNALLDVLLLEISPPAARIPQVVLGLDRIAALLRIESTLKK